MITVDGHVDLCWIQTKLGGFDLRERQTPESGRRVDFPRMHEGGLDAFFAALYLPDSWQDRMTAKEVQNALLAQFNRLYHQPGCHIVRDEDTALDCIDNEGGVPIFLGLEGGRLLGDDLDALAFWHEAGVRYLTLTHNRNTSWANSATDDPQDVPLTDFGISVLHKCHELGILVDVSHVHDSTIEAVFHHAPGKVIATHSGTRTLVGHPRNLEDWALNQLDFVGVPFANKFIGPNYYVSDHIDYLCQRFGDSKHVGIGSDLDGAAMVPSCPDVSRWSHWMDDLSAMDYPDDEIADIAGGNWLRLLS